jgi:hypothetical protein
MIWQQIRITETAIKTVAERREDLIDLCLQQSGRGIAS